MDGKRHRFTCDVPQPDELVSGDVSDIEFFEHLIGEAQQIEAQVVGPVALLVTNEPFGD